MSADGRQDVEACDALDPRFDTGALLKPPRLSSGSRSG